MKRTHDTSRIALVLGLTLASGLVVAAPVELITNGGFETGGFTGWTATSQVGSQGAWYIDDVDGWTPRSSFSTVGPAAGSYYAVTDQIGGGAYSLEQSFTVIAGTTSIFLSFDMFINDWSNAGPIVNPVGLDYTNGPNQHARVDILSASAGAFSIAAADIVATLVAPGADAGTDPNPYTAYQFDLTGLLTAGTTYRLRFGEVDNQWFFNQGIDNVSILADSSQIPEPASLALLSIGLAGLGFARRRRSA